MTRVAINGLGRIGRATLKIVMATPGLELIAANDLGMADDIAYLLNSSPSTDGTTERSQLSTTIPSSSESTSYRCCAKGNRHVCRGDRYKSTSSSNARARLRDTVSFSIGFRAPSGATNGTRTHRE